MRLILIFIIIITACSNNVKIERIKLEKGTKVYQVAEKLGTKFPFLDPEKNQTIIDCNLFAVTTGQVIDELYFHLAPIFDRLMKAESKSQMKKYFYQKAEAIAIRKLAAKAAVSEDIYINKEEMDSLVALFDKENVHKKTLQQYLDEKEKTLNYLKGLLKEQELAKRYMEKKMEGKVNVTDKEIRNRYENDVKLNVRHIFLDTKNIDENIKKEKIQMMNRIKNMLEEGFSFSELAKKYSDDYYTAKKGGLIKGVRQGRFAEEIDKEIFKLNAGEISKILKTNEGLYLFKIEKRSAETRPYEEVYDNYKLLIKIKKRAELQNQIAEELWKKENCVVNPNW